MSVISMKQTEKNNRILFISNIHYKKGMLIISIVNGFIQYIFEIILQILLLSILRYLKVIIVLERLVP